MLKFLKKEANKTCTENGAVTLRSTMSDCLDLFATIGALRNADEDDIVTRFMRAYAEDADLAVKTLFFARDIRGGLGERRVFRIILRWLANNETETVKKNIRIIADYGRYDDLLALMDTPCEADMMAVFKDQLAADTAALEEGKDVSLLAKWLPSANTSSPETKNNARKIAKSIGMKESEYRRTLSALRARIKIVENSLRERDYTFDYEKQPSKALYKYRKAFMRNDEERYRDFLSKAENDPGVMHTETLTPYDVIAPVVKRLINRTGFSKSERRSIDVTWRSLENYVSSDNSLVVVDGSGSMYWNGARMLPAAVAESLAIYFAERNKGGFHNHFITFSHDPRLVEIKGRDIAEKVCYCMNYNECSNTDLEKTLELILATAVNNRLKQSDMPGRIYIISDMEFDFCAANAGATNFENAKARYESFGYKLPQIVFWNVASRNLQQPVSMNEQGVVLVSGSSPQIFSMIKEDKLDPYSFMMEVLSSERYRRIVA